MHELRSIFILTSVICMAAGNGSTAATATGYRIPTRSAAGFRQARGCLWLRRPQAIQPSDLDGAIKEMIRIKRRWLFDCPRPRALENCFPMIPSASA